MELLFENWKIKAQKDPSPQQYDNGDCPKANFNTACCNPTRQTQRGGGSTERRQTNNQEVTP